MTTAPVRHLSIDQFYAEYSDREAERWELVEGIPVRYPIECPTERAAVGVLIWEMYSRLANAYRYEPNSDVFLPPTRGRDTVRMPDLLVRRRVPGVRPEQGDRSGVALVVEVISPGSVRTDRVTKRREYAAAGIPNYLIVEVGPNDGPHLWLFETLVADDASGITTYAKPTGDGTTVTLHIPGADPITVTAADLADAL